ncbi:hypothetical protein Mora3_00002 [Pseudomonas phage vB_PpuP-Mora-3]
MKATDIIKDSAKAVAQIEAIKKAGDKLADSIHIVAVSALFHADEHGDVTIMQRLISALPGFARRNALLAWATNYGKFTINETGDNVDFDKFGKSDVEGALGVTFWAFKPEQPFKPFDLQAEMAKLVKRAEKAAKDERNSLDSDDLIEVRKLASVIKPTAPKVGAETSANDVEAPAADPLEGVA